jgi:hypothetical protein
MIPNIFQEVAYKYPVSVEDLFFAIPDGTREEIELAGELFSAGYSAADVKAMMSVKR